MVALNSDNTKALMKLFFSSFWRFCVFLFQIAVCHCSYNFLFIYLLMNVTFMMFCNFSNLQSQEFLINVTPHLSFFVLVCFEEAVDEHTSWLIFFWVKRTSLVFDVPFYMKNCDFVLILLKCFCLFDLNLILCSS